MKAVAYIRTSTDEQDLGAEAQLHAIEAKHGQVTFYRDIGVSGATPIDQRPGLMAALQALEAGDVLVVAKRDRLARDVVIAAVIERLVAGKGASIESVDGCGNGTGPEAELMRSIISAFAQYERALIRTRTKAALAAKRARMEVTGEVPYGFQRDGQQLVSNVSEQALIARAKALRASGLSLRGIASALKVEGLTGRSGPLHPQQVARLIAA